MPPKKNSRPAGQNRVATRLIQDLRSAVGQKVRSKTPKRRPAPGPQRPLSSGAESSLTKYEAALLHPFSPMAEGARYPEPYAAHTIVRKMRMEYVITPSAAGDFDLAIQPHLVYSGFSSNGTISGAPVTLGITNQPVGVNYFGTIGQTSLAGLFKSYRVVGWGVRLKANTDFTRSGGRVICAVTPASQQVPAAVSSGCTTTQFYDCFDIPSEPLGAGRVITSSVLSLPRGHQLAVSEMMAEGGAEITFPIVSASATNFLEAANEYQEQALVTATGANAVGDRFSLGYASCAGHSQLLLRGVGINTTVSGVLVAEVVYHIEGIPNPISGSQLVESPVRLPPASPAAIAAVVHKAASVPAVQYVSSKMKEASGTIFSAARNALSSRFGQAAERVLGLGMKALVL